MNSKLLIAFLICVAMLASYLLYGWMRYGYSVSITDYFFGTVEKQ